MLTFSTYTPVATDEGHETKTFYKFNIKSCPCSVSFSTNLFVYKFSSSGNSEALIFEQVVIKQIMHGTVK